MDGLRELEMIMDDGLDEYEPTEHRLIHGDMMKDGASQKPQHILIVDDQPANLLALMRTLACTGAGFVKAGSGEEALAATLRQDFALAILDVRMPGMSGFELAGYLRGDHATRHIPIIFLTAASPDEEQIFKGYKSGGVDYMIKPFNPDILVSKVKVFLELHRQKIELRQHREQLATVNRELQAFSYSVSHDLRAPLRAIEGFSNALMEDCFDQLDDLGRDYLGRVSGEARRMSGLIDGLLMLSRLTRAQLQPRQIDLSRSARAVISRLQESTPGREVEVIIEEGLIITGDPTLIDQALENLLSNAWKFTTGCPAPRIEVGRRRGVFFVKDNGVGFDMSYADKLFTPFQRLHGVQEFPGTGIGLSIVQRIITRHEGRVWHHSAPGQGATFHLVIPLADDLFETT